MCSTITGYLMMGALSPGLKRHSVTLFEGGRVAGDDVVRELVDELWASYAAGQGFEDDMLRLTHYAAALGSLLEAVRASAGPGAALELLRKESLAGLAPTAAAKVLHHAYSAVVPISPLPPPVLPLSPYAPGPTHFGPTLEAASPWLSLALYQAARSGPQSFVLVCGQRVWRLPHPLDSCTHALVTLWDPEADPQRVRAHGAEGCGPTLVEAPFLLYTLNELLSRTAVLVQPLWCAEPDSCPDVVDVPLPLPSPQQQEPVAGAGVQGAGGGSQGEGGTGGKGAEGATAAVNAAGGELGGGQRPDGSVCVAAIRQRGGDSVPVLLPAPLVAALRQLGLAACVGHLRLMRHGGSSSTSSISSHVHHHSFNSHTHSHKQQQGSAPGADAGTTASAGYSSEPSSVGRVGAAAAAGGGDSSAGTASDGAVAAAAATAAGGAHGSGGGGGGAAWGPLSAHLGVPLHCLPLCKAVCRAASAAGFLTPEGRRTQQQAQLTLQNHLTKLLLSYTHAALDGSYGSAGPQQLAAVVAAAAAGEGAGGTCAGSGTPADSGYEGPEGSTAVGSAGPFSTAAATATVTAGPGAGQGAGEDKGAPAAPGGEQGAAGSAAAAGAGLGAVLPLPAVNLSFDGHSLQPIRLRDSVQGLGCLCQG